MKRMAALACSVLMWACSTVPPWGPDSPAEDIPDDWLESIGPRISDLRDRDSIRVLILGDTGRLRSFKTTAAGAEKACDSRCDLAVMLGDNFYQRGPRTIHDPRFRTHFAEPMARFAEGFDVWAVLGNHGYLGDPRSQIRFTFSEKTTAGPDWLMPAQFFAVPKLPSWLRIAGIDSELLVDGRHFGGNPEQLASTRKAHLAGTRAALGEESGWRLLAGHHPLYSTGHHAAERELGSLRKILLDGESPPAFDLYLAGHDHDQQVVETGRFVQIIQGAASKVRSRWRARHRRRAFASLPEGTVAEYCNQLGFGIAEIDRRTLRLTFYLADGEAIRQWTWHKSEDGHIRRETPAERGPIDICPG